MESLEEIRRDFEGEETRFAIFLRKHPNTLPRKVLPEDGDLHGKMRFASVVTGSYRCLVSLYVFYTELDKALNSTTTSSIRQQKQII